MCDWQAHTSRSFRRRLRSSKPSFASDTAKTITSGTRLVSGLIGLHVSTPLSQRLAQQTLHRQAAKTRGEENQAPCVKYSSVPAAR